MLEVTAPASETALRIDFANVFKNSEPYRSVHIAVSRNSSFKHIGQTSWNLERIASSIIGRLLCFFWTAKDYYGIATNSLEYIRRNKDLIKELSVPAPGSNDLDFPTKYSQSFFTQCMACLWKQHWSYWRNPSYTAVRLMFTTLTALVFGTIFWRLGSKMYVNGKTGFSPLLFLKC